MKASIVVVSVTFVFIAVLAAGWMWMSSVNEDMMYVPRPRDTVLVRETLAPVFGEAADTIEVFRVDRDISAYFFTMERREGFVEDAIVALPEQGWEILDTPPASSKDLDQRLTAQLTGVEQRILFVTIKPLDEDRFYGACGHRNIEVMWKRYKENEKYLK